MSKGNKMCLPAVGTLVRSTNIPYSERLDHLRFLAALMVMSFHSFHPIYRALTNAPSSANAAVNPVSIFFVEGHTAVGLFLTLSGFLFARICLGSIVDFKQFYLNRLLRVYPLFVCALIVSMCVVPASFLSFLTSLCTFQTLPDALKGNYVDHLWSIGVEIQFYVLFPALLLAYRKNGQKYLLGVVLLCLLALGFVQLSTGATRDVAYATILGRLNQAVIGMMLGFSFDRFRPFISSPAALLLSLGGVSAALQWLHSCGGMPGTGNNPIWVFWLTIEAVLWGAVICSYQACTLRLPDLVSRPLAHLGSISYSLYVMHYALACALCAWFTKLLLAPGRWHHSIAPVREFLMQHPLETSLLAGTFVILPPTVLFSLLTFNVIERPFMGLRRKYVLPVEPNVVPPTAGDKKQPDPVLLRG